LTSGEDSRIAREKKSKETQEQREERENTKRERSERKKKKKSSPLLSLFLLFCFSLSLSLVFFFGSAFFGSPFSLSKSFSLSRRRVSVSLSPAILMNLREVFRERHFAAQKRRALQREKRERERERERDERERARAQTNTLYRRKFLSFALSLRHYREE
jgi:cation transport ATPase